VSALESSIDELYQKPPGEFTAARNALAKTLSGDDAARVRKLAKPTVVPFAVNLLYWHARATYDRLRKAGETLRAAQVATLKGKPADVRGASEAHRKAISDAAAQAAALAAREESKPDADELTRTLEALSIASELPEQPGRLTRALKPAGFEALASVPLKAITTKDTKDTKEQNREKREKEEARKKEEAKKRAEAEAETAVDRAAAAEAQAKRTWERAKRDLDAAERRLGLVRSNTS
jgi:colicin import membrane protein